MAHATPLRIDSNARVLQFAAHTFDGSLVESLTPLMHGACVCIPDEEDRLSNIVSVINDMKINTAMLTPSFIEFIDPSSVPGLETVVLAGEAMSPSHLVTWSERYLINGYGPTESAVSAVLNPGISIGSSCRDIGFAVGVRSWIVNPENHDQLVPVGCPGELLIEGPTLSRGYLNNREKTNEAFIYDPAWSIAATDTPGERRFYKTGDLVRYSTDAGCLTYIGRKDAQIKFHGQRIELGELESHISADAKVKHCMVLFPKSGFSKGKILAAVSPSFQKDDSSELNLPFKLLDQRKKVALVAEVREKLSKKLPTYMIPSVWLCLEAFPFLTSGKLDRKSIVSWVENMESDPDLQVTRTDTDRDQTDARPMNERESLLVSTWSRILNIPIAHINPNDSFLALGGDSIAAITCVSHCKKQGLGFTVQEVLQSKSVRELATRAKAVSHSTAYEEAVDEPFDLSPVQKLHFRLRREDQGHFNQSILTRLSKKVEVKDLQHAIETLVKRHSMLRARFAICCPEVVVRQRITRDISGSYHLSFHNVKWNEEVNQVISDAQARMNSTLGPVLAINLFNIDGQDMLLSLVAHHLVVDIVSWRIILEDLEDLLLNPHEAVSQNGSLPFQTWCRLQADQAQTVNLERKMAFRSLPAPDFSYWGMEASANTYGNAVCETFEIDSDKTSLIIKDCHKSLQTEPVDIFLATLLHAFRQTFKDHSPPAIYNEGHGREVWDPSLDISRTVGWFTTVYPIFLEDVDLGNPHENVMRVKDIRRSAPGNGREDFARRMLSDADGEVSQHCPMEITFNYVGQHRDLQRPDGLFQLTDHMAGETSKGGGAADFGEETPRFALFEISAVVVQGRLRFSFSFNKSMHHQMAIRDWISRSCELLTSIAEQLRSLEPRPTLSDFPMLSLTYDSLETIMSEKLPRIGIDSLDVVEDIYPCSRLQQGVLLSRSRDSSLYAVHGTFEVKGVGNSKPDADRLKLAWQNVVSHHAMLRTVFVENLTDGDLFCQVVLKDFKAQPVHIQCNDDDHVIEKLDNQKPMDYHQHRPVHRFSICQTATGKLFCRLEMSHAAMDGVSISIILRDLQAAYSDALDETRKPLYKNFMRYLLDSPQNAALNYWCSYLSNMQPSNFPVLDDGKGAAKRLECLRLNFDSYSELRSFSEASGITLSTAINAAWGLTLRSYLGTDDVCFGYMASLRDLPVDEIESMVGPVINLMTCRMKMPGDSVINHAIHQVQSDYMESFPYRHTSLIDIQHALQLSDTALFNTCVSYQKLPPKDDNPKGELQFLGKDSIHDPAEFSVFVNVEAAENDAQIELNYWTHALSDGQAQNLASTFLHLLNGIMHYPNTTINRLDSLSEKNMEQILLWNRNIPEAVEQCIHELFDSKASLWPNGLAVTSCDGNFTYAELLDLSSRLAAYLTILGVGSGSLVPIDFEKSKWVVVAILAILKAGGTCIPLDLFSSPIYLSKLTANNGAQVALVSPSRAQLLEGKIPLLVSVDSSLLDYLPEDDGDLPSSFSPSDAAYAVSGDTNSDDPKHVILDHRAILTRADNFSRTLGMNSETRLFQHTVYTSDLFLQEAFGTLICGGCVCIAPDNSLIKISEFANQFEANLISLTPSVATFVEPADVPKVSIVALSGERLSRKAKSIWSAKAQLHTLHGSLECSSTCIHDQGSRYSSESGTIGSSSGCISWVVDHSNHNQLVPIGCVGELLIEGPTLACGYLDEQSLTESNFIENPEWISAFRDGTTAANGTINFDTVFPRRRMFKTGTLVRYNSDGSLLYVGEKSGGIKYRQIEDQIETALPSEYRCAVERVNCYNYEGKDDGEQLAVFVFPKTKPMIATSNDNPLVEHISPHFQDLITTIRTHLLNSLPFEQVPNLYFPVSTMPLSSLGKLNRRILRDEVHNLPTSLQLAHNVEEFSRFWRLRLANPKSPEFPQLPGMHRSVRSTSQLDRTLEISWDKVIGSCAIDQNSAILAAWALAVSNHTESTDVIFGELLPDDDFSSANIQPDSQQSTAIVPRRIRIDRSSTIAGLVKDTRAHLEEALPYQHTSLERITKLSADASKACNFHNFISISRDECESQVDSVKQLDSLSRTFPFVILCKITGSQLQLSVLYDEKVMSMPRVEAVLKQLADHLETVCSDRNQKTIGDTIQSLPNETMLSDVDSFNTGSNQASGGGIEDTLRSLWEMALGLKPGSVSAEDSFFGRGGDSVSAMRLVGAAQSHGISLKVADIFKSPVFMDMVTSCTVSTEDRKATLSPLKLLPDSAKLEDILEEVADQCRVDKKSIADIYPCSPVQEGLLTLSIKQSGAYIAQPTFCLADGVDIDKFKIAWQQTVNQLDILRTRIVHTESANFVQAVLHGETISWASAETLDNLPSDTLESHNGGLLTGYTIVESNTRRERHFVWTVHHALYDGWTVPLILKRVEENYFGSLPEQSVIPYALFIDHLSKVDMSESDQFWKSYLSNLSSSPFPQNKNTLSNAARAGNIHRSSLDITMNSIGGDLTLPMLIRAAWAVVVSTHTGSGDVCYGETLTGRNINLPGIAEITGPTLTTVPTRILVDNALTISQYLKNVQRSTVEMIPHQHSGLQHIRKLSTEAAAACEFQNLLVIQLDDDQLNDTIWTSEGNPRSEEFFTHPLVMECKISGSKILTTVNHDELVIGNWLTQKLVDQFHFVLSQLLLASTDETRKLGDLELFSPQDREQVAQWNPQQPAGVDRCIHDLILEKSLVQPDAMAACGWDGQISYRELHEAASSFAKYLSSRGIGIGSVVPICLDKSIWVAVTILSILMTGGSFVPLDPAHPTSRHEEILAEVNANTILCSPHHCNRYSKVVKTVIPISKETIRAYGALKNSAKLADDVPCSTMAYALFTSGSTGRPKGIILEHKAVVSSVMAFGPVVGLGSSSRVFQFASLTFDAAILEVLGTLLFGGCICFPSEDERLNDVAGAIRRMSVSWSFLTPAIAGLIEPAAVPSLKTIACGGEAVPREIVNKWLHRVNLLIAYGPTETTVFATINAKLSSNRDPACIGWGIPSTLTWVVDPDNHNRLAPLGAIGELTLEGPPLAREYLKNPEKTAEAFVIEPAWESAFPTGTASHRRLYKTGDLVKYNPDGSLVYMGRKDHQVKLNGNRMELGEIEFRMKENTRIGHAIVVLPKAGPLQKRLVAVLTLKTLSSVEDIASGSACELVSDDDMVNFAYSELAGIQKNLEDQLPIYMVPQTWAVIRKMPMLVSGKLDRKTITNWVGNVDDSLYDRIMHDYSIVKQSKANGTAAKSNDKAVVNVLQEIFAQVLNLPSHKVSLDRSFVRLGKFFEKPWKYDHKLTLWYRR